MIPFANTGIFKISIFFGLVLFPTKIFPALINANQLLQEPSNSNAIDFSSLSGPDLSQHNAFSWEVVNQSEIDSDRVRKRSAEKPSGSIIDPDIRNNLQIVGNETNAFNSPSAPGQYNQYVYTDSYR